MVLSVEISIGKGLLNDVYFSAFFFDKNIKLNIFSWFYVSFKEASRFEGDDNLSTWPLKNVYSSITISKINAFLSEKIK